MLKIYKLQLEAGGRSHQKFYSVFHKNHACYNGKFIFFHCSPDRKFDRGRVGRVCLWVKTSNHCESHESCCSIHVPIFPETRQVKKTPNNLGSCFNTVVEVSAHSP